MDMRGMRPRTMATSSQRCRRGQLWQSLKILSGSSDLSSTVRKPYLKKKSGMRVKRQTDWTPCPSASSMSAARMRPPAPWPLAAGATTMERTSAEEDAAIGLGDGEVANVFAYFGEGTLEQRAVGGERVHQVVDVGGVVEQGLTHQHQQPPSLELRSVPTRLPRLDARARARFRRSRRGNRAWLAK